LLVTNFTTTTMVNNRISASSNNSWMLFDRKNVFMWLICWYEIGGLIFRFLINNIDDVNTSNNGNVILVFVCWLGVKATKYANITNMPPT